MKTKAIGILVCLLLIATVLPIVNSIDNINEKKKFNVFNSDNVSSGYDCGCGKTNSNRHRFGGMKEISLPLHSDKTSTKPAVMDTPEYFNWMDFEGQDWTTPAKFQGYCGSCSDFAALGVLESIIKIREGNADLNVDLSEQYVLSCLPRAVNCFGGGNPYNVFYYILSNKSSGNNCNGIIPEYCFPYRAIDADGHDIFGDDHDPILCDEKCEDWEEYLIPISDCGKWYPDGSSEDRDAIKTQIMQIGPVATSMQSTWYIHDDDIISWGFKNLGPDDYFSSSLQFNTIDHCVAIVGWKDDPSIDNGGYWICKNSWWSEWGLDNFFNIEYDSLRIDSSEIIWVDYNPDAFVNWLPIADLGGIYYGDVGYELMFNSSGSFDHEGEIISYEWDFVDGNHGSGMNATHIYESQGVYSVMLTVIDNEGNTGNDTTYAFIDRSNDPPNTPTINGPLNGKEGVEYDYNISAIDPDGDDIYYFIFWGDDSRLEDYWIGPYSSGETVTVNHTWNDKSTFTISVKAKDEYDFKSAWATFEVSMTKNKPFDHNFSIIDWLFERFPNAFPILKHLQRLTIERNYENSIFLR
jgi:C1A family cysteine protease